MERFTRDPPALNLQVTHERIMTDPSGSGSALALIGQVARILNSGLAADETLRVVVATLKAGLQARSVVIWRRETHGAGFAGITVPTGEHAAFSLDDLPAAPGLPEVLCALLVPSLDPMSLSEALPLEVGSRSREIDEQRRFTSL